jgi:hypothetical protein
MVEVVPVVAMEAEAGAEAEEGEAREQRWSLEHI